MNKLSFKSAVEPIKMTKIQVKPAKKQVRVAFEFMEPFLNSSDMKSWNKRQHKMFINILSRLDNFERYDWYFVKIPLSELKETFGVSENVIIEDLAYMKENCYIENVVNPVWGFLIEDNVILNFSYNKKYVAVQLNPAFRMFYDEAGNM